MLNLSHMHTVSYCNNTALWLYGLSLPELSSCTWWARHIKKIMSEVISTHNTVVAAHLGKAQTDALASIHNTVCCSPFGKGPGWCTDGQHPQHLHYWLSVHPFQNGSWLDHRLFGQFAHERKSWRYQSIHSYQHKPQIHYNKLFVCKLSALKIYKDCIQKNKIVFPTNFQEPNKKLFPKR